MYLFYNRKKNSMLEKKIIYSLSLRKLLAILQATLLFLLYMKRYFHIKCTVFAKIILLVYNIIFVKWWCWFFVFSITVNMHNEVVIGRHSFPHLVLHSLDQIGPAPTVVSECVEILVSPVLDLQVRILLLQI